MKPHFGQSDAAMNKLAGCNRFPNAGKTFDLTELEQEIRVSENYQYAECKHCGQSVMEGQIHSCKKMFLAEIEELKEKLAAVCFERNLAQIDVHRFREALEKIARGTLEPGHLYNQAVRMQEIAREALADRP